MNSFHHLAGPPITHLAAHPCTGPALESPMPPVPGDPRYQHPRALARDALDTLLLNRARQLGVTVLQPCHTTAVEGNAADGFTLHTSHGKLHARTVVLAHGLAQKGSLQPHPPPRTNPAADTYLCFKAHFQNIPLVPHTIAIGGGHDLYAGLVRTSDVPESKEPPRFSLAFVIHRHRLARTGPSAENAFAYLLHANPGFRALLKNARLVPPPYGTGWLACGPLSPGIRQIYSDGRFFVGNAAGEVHALVGEGMTLALRGAQRLSEAIAARGLDALPAAGLHYENAWRAEFSHRYDAANLFANLLMRPTLASMAATFLHAFPDALRWCIQYSGKRAAS